METEEIRVIKPCCDSMKSAIEHNTIYMFCDEPCIDTGIYDDNPMPIDYCPYCGKIIKVYVAVVEVEEIEDSDNPPFITAYTRQLIESLDEKPLFWRTKDA